MFERFTGDARQVVVGAQAEARALRHGWIGTEHLLIGLLAAAGGASKALAEAGLTREIVTAEIARLTARRFLGDGDADALRVLGIDLEAVRAKVEDAFGPGALERAQYCDPKGRRRVRPVSRHIPFTPCAKKILELSLREALRLKHNWIGPEHILLGLLREGDGLAAQVLVNQGVSGDVLRERVLAALETAA